MTDKGTCKHGEFDLVEGCKQCIEEQQRTSTEEPPEPPAEGPMVFTEKGFPPPPESIETTALINIEAGQDERVLVLYDEGVRLLEYAGARRITTNEDLKPATDDLSTIAKLKKAIEEKRKEYLEPIRAHLDKINLAFKSFTEPLLEADCITRDKIKEFRQIEIDKMAIARREMEAKGETTVEFKDKIPDRVHTGMGTLGTKIIYKWEVEDITKVPHQYLMPNAGAITGVVQSSKGKIVILGIRVYEEKTTRINTR